MDVYAGISTRRTAQITKADPRQVKNSAGGCTFTLEPEAQLRRFLMLGTDGATYYTSAQELTKANAAVVIKMAETDHATLVRVIVETSVQGRAPRQNPTIFALAIAASVGTSEERNHALAVLPTVCRTGTHLFLFAKYVEQFRGWGRGLRRGIGHWYLGKDEDALAYQMVKYRNREGWSHRDLLRLSHPETVSLARADLFDWATKGNVGEHTPVLVEQFLKVNEPGADVAALVREYVNLSWEMLPTEALNDAKVWEALLDNGVPQTALMRQLPRLTQLGLLPQMGGRTNEIAARLSDAERLRKARVHPVNVLVAHKTYAQGHGMRGSSQWSPTAKIVDALNDAFYAAYGAVEPTGKRTMLALDVSGSMTSPISNMPLTCREASAALALVTANVESEHMFVGFTGGGGWYGRRSQANLTPLAISPRQRLRDAVDAVSNLPFGGTDCALPMVEALKNKWEVDVFHIYTDNETWAGSIHPHQALTEYRQKTGIDAKLVVVGMTATNFSIADPSDTGSLDVVGFDSAVPSLIADFAR